MPAFLLVAAQVVLLVLWLTTFPTMSAWLVFSPVIAAAAFALVFFVGFALVVACSFKVWR